jgi:hypothetical protein
MYAFNRMLLGNQIRDNELGGTCSTPRKMRNACKILVGISKGKCSLWIPDRKWDLKELRCKNVDFIHLAQDRDQWRILLNMVMNLLVT